MNGAFFQTLGFVFVHISFILFSGFPCRHALLRWFFGSSRRLTGFRSYISGSSRRLTSFCRYISGSSRRLIGVRSQFFLQFFQPQIQFVKTDVMFGRKNNRITQSQFIGLVNSLLLGSAFAFIGQQKYRLFAAAYQIGKMFVISLHSGSCIEQKQHGVRFFNRAPGLLPHPFFHLSGGRLFITGRIYNGQFQIFQLCCNFLAVSGNAGQVVNQCQLLAGQTIKQSRLADIRPSDDCCFQSHFIPFML